MTGPLPRSPADAPASPDLLADLPLDRATTVPLSEQIVASLRAAILERRLAPGARLPSWRDLATQLGVARGTVRAAYDRLSDERLITPAGAAGTRVARAPPTVEAPTQAVRIERPLQDMEPAFSAEPLPFQMGVPAQDAFPVSLWARLRARSVRDEASGPVGYPDPRGELALRAQIAAYLAIARGIRCVPDQIIVTCGYRGGLQLAIRALRLERQRVWIEDPGYPIGRMALELAGAQPVPVAVDDEGLDVAQGIAQARDAAAALLTPGQQAPLGVALSASRRAALLRWAAQSDAWILEDDYLSELQLDGRLAPALAADDPWGRVIHLGTFSKTLSPAIGLGFVVVPVAQATHFGQVAACLSPAPNVSAQHSVARFIAEGHYLRHIRHMKRLYAQRRDALRAQGSDWPQASVTMSGLAVRLELPPHRDDVAIAARALASGLAPAPLSPWYLDASRRRPGLLLGVTNLREDRIAAAVAGLKTLLD